MRDYIDMKEAGTVRVVKHTPNPIVVREPDPEIEGDEVESHQPASFAKLIRKTANNTTLEITEEESNVNVDALEDDIEAAKRTIAAAQANLADLEALLADTKAVLA